MIVLKWTSYPLSCKENEIYRVVGSGWSVKILPVPISGVKWGSWRCLTVCGLTWPSRVAVLQHHTDGCREKALPCLDACCVWLHVLQWHLLMAVPAACPIGPSILSERTIAGGMAAFLAAREPAYSKRDHGCIVTLVATLFFERGELSCL